MFFLWILVLEHAHKALHRKPGSKDKTKLIMIDKVKAGSILKLYSVTGSLQHSDQEKKYNTTKYIIVAPETFLQS